MIVYYAVSQAYMESPRVKFFYSKAARDRWCKQRSLTPRRPIDAKGARAIMTDYILNNSKLDIEKIYEAFATKREISYWTMQELRNIYEYISSK